MNQGEIPVHGIFQKGAHKTHNQRRAENDMVCRDITSGHLSGVVLDAAQSRGFDPTVEAADARIDFHVPQNKNLNIVPGFAHFAR